MQAGATRHVSQNEQLFRVLDEPLSKLPESSWQAATAASFLSWSYRCTPVKRASRALALASAQEASDATLRPVVADAAGDCSGDPSSRRSYRHSRTCGSAVGEAEVQICNDQGAFMMKKVPSKPGGGKNRPSTAPRHRCIAPLGTPTSQRSKAKTKAKAKARPFVAARAALPQAPTTATPSQPTSQPASQPPPHQHQQQERHVIVAAPGELMTAASTADSGVVPKPPSLPRPSVNGRPCKAERKRQQAQDLATREEAAAVEAMEKRLERVNRLVQECEQRIQSKTVPRMRRLLRPYPEGYWVTRGGLIVKMTSDEMIWPNGKRERIEMDLEAGTLLVCSCTASFLDPKAAVRRARFVASEIVWEMGDRWVEFIGEIDEDPRQLVLADPSVESQEAYENSESEEEAEEESEMVPGSKASSCDSFGEDSDSSTENSCSSSHSNSEKAKSSQDSDDSDSDIKGDGPQMGHAATSPTKTLSKPHSRSSIFAAADSRPISKRSSDGALHSNSKEGGKRASTGLVQVAGGKRQSTQRASAIPNRRSQSKIYGPPHGSGSGSGSGDAPFASLNSYTGDGNGKGISSASTNANIGTGASDSHNGTLGSSDDVVRLLSQELHESPAPPTTPPKLLAVGTRHHSIQPLGSTSSLQFSMSSLPSLQDRDGSGSNTPSNRSVRSVSMSSPPRTPIQMSVMPSLSGSNRASTSGYGQMVLPPGKRRSVARAAAKRKATFEGKEFEKQEAQVLAGTLAEDLKTRFRGAVHESGSSTERRPSDLWKMAPMARDLSLTHDDIREASLIFEAGLGRSKHLQKLTYQQFESVAAQLLEANSMGNHLDIDALKVCCRDHWSAAKHKMHVPQMDFKECLGWYSRNRFNTDLTCTKEQRLHIDMARKYRCPEKTIHDIKSCYDQFDKDGSGNISLEEFAGVLKLLMKLPGDGDLPKHRIEFLWREIDFDGSGFACFEEFTRWWMSRRTTLIPYDGYYRTIRDLSREPDPIVHYDDAD